MGCEGCAFGGMCGGTFEPKDAMMIALGENGVFDKFEIDNDDDAQHLIDDIFYTFCKFCGVDPDKKIEVHNVEE